MTTSRICEAVNGFHNVTFGPGGKAKYPAQCFGNIPGFLEFFSRLSAIFLNGRGNLKENYVMLFTKFDWSVISSSRSKYCTF